VTGTLPTANGGTNLTSFTSGGVVYASSSSALATGSALTFNGTTLTVNADGIGHTITRGSSNGYLYHNGNAGSADLTLQSQNGSVKLFTESGSGGTIKMVVEGTEGMRLTSTGLGIGTSSPSSKLHVGVVGGGVIARFAHTGETNNPYAYFKTSEAGNLASLGSYSSGGNSALGFLTADTERMRITSAGDVGIGTTSPSTKLTVYDATTPQVTFNNGTSTFIVGNNAGGNNKILYGTGAYPMIFYTDAIERARITSGGECLFGTTSGLNSATITAQSSNTCANLITSTSAEYSLNAWNQATSGNNNFILFQTESSPTTRGTINYNRAGGLVVYNTTSDYRAKDIYGPVNNSGALIDSIPVYTGKMKGATQERPMFIAHEVPAYARTGEKDAIDADGNPVYQQMDASALIPVMWAEIQSLRQRLSAANL
jgi:hypothetical protein